MGRVAVPAWERSLRGLPVAGGPDRGAQNIARVSALEWAVMRFCDGLNLKAQFAQIMDVARPTWAGGVNGGAALLACGDYAFQRPAVSPGYCDGLNSAAGIGHSEARRTPFVFGCHLFSFRLIAKGAGRMFGGYPQDIFPSHGPAHLRGLGGSYLARSAIAASTASSHQ